MSRLWRRSIGGYGKRRIWRGRNFEYMATYSNPSQAMSQTSEYECIRRIFIQPRSSQYIMRVVHGLVSVNAVHTPTPPSSCVLWLSISLNRCIGISKFLLEISPRNYLHTPLSHFPGTTDLSLDFSWKQTPHTVLEDEALQWLTLRASRLIPTAPSTRKFILGTLSQVSIAISSCSMSKYLLKMWTSRTSCPSSAKEPFVRCQS